MNQFTETALLTMLPGWRLERSGGAPLADCTLAVPTFRRQAECLTLLNALDELKDKPGEVVFIDGARDPDFSAALLAWGSCRRLSFDLVYAASPAGLTLQRNVGVDISTGKYIFFLDDDAVPLDRFFAEIRAVFECDTKEEIGAVAGCIVNEMNCPIDRRWGLRFATGLVPRAAPMNYLPCGIHVPRGLLKPFRGTRDVNVFFGGAVALRRDVFDTMRFSEYFQGYSFGEDTEMALRVSSQWRVVCSGDAHMLHNPAPHGRPPGLVRGRMEFVNRHFIWKRHIGRPSLPDRLRFWVDAMLQLGLDAAWFVIRPWKFAYATHGIGLAAGMVQCWMAPPRYEEPPPHRRFALKAVAVEAATRA
jgi:GT2 family glycosyltransferase